MNKVVLVLAIFLLTVSTSFGQMKDFYVGASLSFHQESRSKMIYGPGLEERNSLSHFLGTGISVQKRLNEAWGLNVGLAYVNRQYKMEVPFNHCYFSNPGEFCTAILAHVDKYGYRTLEVPIGINRYFISNGSMEIYINVTALTAFDFQSFYNPNIIGTETVVNKEVNLFSGSLISGFGFGYHLTEKLKINLEPFVRLIHTRRQDPILITGYEDKWTHFDNLGANLVLMRRL